MHPTWSTLHYIDGIRDMLRLLRSTMTMTTLVIIAGTERLLAELNSMLTSFDQHLIDYHFPSLRRGVIVKKAVLSSQKVSKGLLMCKAQPLYPSHPRQRTKKSTNRPEIMTTSLPFHRRTWLKVLVGQRSIFGKSGIQFAYKPPPPK